LFAGIYQILHTPFTEDGAVDWGSYERQIEYCIRAQVHGLVVPAMASEFFTLTDQERFDVVEFALKQVNRRVPVLVGAQGLTRYAAAMFAEHAARHNADGLMAMPPYLRKASKAETEAYYLALAAFGLPVMIQNAPALSGSALPPAEVAALLAAHDCIEYVKEEAPPILQRISQVISAAGEFCKGVFGGANGIYLLDELDRGAVGNMPAGGFIDVQVKIYNLYAAGQRDEAEALHLRALPLLLHASVYGSSLHKYLLWRRGVIQSPYSRDPQRIVLDKHDEAAIAKYWRLIEPDTLEEYPFR
jgi:4-hydroxy-tetrahydrodipicolinate synthase